MKNSFYLKLFNIYKKYIILDDSSLYFSKSLSNVKLQKELEKIKKYLEKPSEQPKFLTKEAAAFIQDTHKAPQSMAYFLISNPETDDFEVLTVDVNGDYKTKLNINHQNICLIENQECFFRYKEFLNKKYFKLPKNYIVLYTGGHKGTTDRLNKFLNLFNVYCFFDYDSAGYSMFKHITTKHKRFCLPHRNVLEKAISMIKKSTKQHNRKLIKTNISDKEISKLTENIFIEQEIFLNKNLERE